MIFFLILEALSGFGDWRLVVGIVALEFGEFGFTIDAVDFGELSEYDLISHLYDNDFCLKEFFELLEVDIGLGVRFSEIILLLILELHEVNEMRVFSFLGFFNSFFISE